ncbi:MAG TPA: DNA translocase FtsK 4TM domain-containing protein [Candidatus Binatia bacterium]
MENVPWAEKVKEVAMGKSSRLIREIWGVVIGVLAILLVLSLVSYSPSDRSLNTPSGNLHTVNWGGVVGAYLADFLLQGLGLASYLLPPSLIVLSFALFREAQQGLRLARTIGFGLVLWSMALFLSLFRDAPVAREAGGILGGFSKQTLTALFGQGGTYLIASSLLLLALMLACQISLASTFGRLVHGLQRIVGGTWLAIHQLYKGLAARLQERKEKLKSENKKRERREFKVPPILLKDESNGTAAPVKIKKKAPPTQEQFELPQISRGFSLPSLAFLDTPDGGQVKIDRGTLEANSLILQKKLTDFGIEGEVVAVRPGPVITMYEFKPASGVKVRRIVTLADDLSMVLRAVSVRILAPIPGESAVGIEIPNPKREKVYLKQLLESPIYKNSESKVTLAVGKDTAGSPYVTDLARMPHLLVAGATGSGKSVSINAMILSILFKATPQDVQFIMIDPKMLELSIYENLPHLLAPVVVEPKKATAALYWTIEEMDRRYRLMRDKGARDLDHYNRLLTRDTAREKVIELGPVEENGVEDDAPVDNLEARSPLVHERLARIVVVVDELADLMMTAGRDVEEYITRLAQKARAAGIHMILATQRPSVDVITGLIKANFPARVSFQTTSRVDSRTILDSIGAERLLGDGDMLFLSPGTARPMRIHGAYVSDREIRKVVEFVKQQGPPRYRKDILEAKKEGASPNGEDAYDEMYDAAVELVAESQQASISMIQRRLRVGYNRAARMIEQMEKDGVIGPADGVKPREVYARKLEG